MKRYHNSLKGAFDTGYWNGEDMPFPKVICHDGAEREHYLFENLDLGDILISLVGCCLLVNKIHSIHLCK